MDTSAFANEKGQALALLTRSLGKGSRKRRDTFTVPVRAQAAGRIHPVRNMRFTVWAVNVGRQQRKSAGSPLPIFYRMRIYADQFLSGYFGSSS
jgi:hypothetical protein